MMAAPLKKGEGDFMFSLLKFALIRTNFVRFMQTVRILRLVFLAGFAAFASLRAAPADDARAALVGGIDEVSAVIRANPSHQDLITTLDTLVDKYFAFATTTRLSIGPAWRDLTPEQRAKLTTLFSRLVIRTYADHFQSKTPPVVTYSPAQELRAGRYEIPTRVVTSNQTYSISYRLDYDPPSQRWRVYDIVAEGVSLISNYRAQFDPIVHKSGGAGLIQALETKLADSSSR
jgi:phospholipid transport system substrate-binding protein